MDANHELDKMAEDPELVVSVEFAAKLYHAFIGDIEHGYRARADMPSFAAAVRWLQEQACRFYPHSKYTQDLPTRVISTTGRRMPGRRMLTH
jgi:hypothetical protein